MQPPRELQTDGLTSRVYVPILLHVFNAKYHAGDTEITFTLDDLREAATELGIILRNPGDLIYRMRSRTKLPAEILAKGFFILRATERGKYRLERAESTIIETPNDEITETIDTTPLPVRRLLPEVLSEVDEQGLLTIVGYCRLLDHFTGLQVFRLRSHVRKSVPGVGQAELDEVDVGVALREDEVPIVFPIEAKAAPDAINRVQISAMVAFTNEYFKGHDVRPIAIKLDYDSLVHFLEFNPTTEPAQLAVVRSATYRLGLSEQQREMIRQSRMKLF